jgi:sulfur-oxidizing protein SoxY
MNNENLTRRSFMAAASIGALTLTLAPFAAEATPHQVLDAIGKVIGERAPKEGRVSIVLPEIAENGGVVPLKVAVDSPMTAADFVKSVHLFADGNPLPEIANYHFGPDNGKAEFALRIRLAKTQKIVAVAEMSDGQVFMARREVKVTLGGCGG